MTCRLQVASYMRAVLRTLVQCHAQHILHRDIKPGNFMLLEDQLFSPVKAIGQTRAQFVGRQSRLPLSNLSKS